MKRHENSPPTVEGPALEQRAPSTVYSLSEQETKELGRRLAESLKGGELIVLDGDLGMGKTVFARGIAAGARRRRRRSPFALVLARA